MKHINQQNKRVSPSPQKGAITERGLFRLMLPSLLGILLCSTCLAGLTWAYFSDSVTSTANTITAATFTVDVTITEITETGGDPLTTVEAGSASTLDTPANEEGGTDTGTVTQPGGTTTGEGGTPVKGTPEAVSVLKNEAAGEGTTTGEGSTSAVKRNAGDSYTLHAGKKYTVTLKASGTATGYCKVTVNENDYYTEKMGPARELVFSIDCSSMTSETTVRITPGWVNSDYPNIEGEAATNKIDSGSTIVTPTTGANTTTTEQSASAAAAKTDETLREEIVQSNEQTNNGETAGGTTENTTADTNDETTGGSTVETARTVPGESSKTTGESTDGNEEPANEGTDTEKANSEPSADEPTDPPSEGQSEE